MMAPASGPRETRVKGKGYVVMKAFKIVGCIMCIHCSVALGGTVDYVSRSVVFLRDSKPVTKVVNGTSYQVWLWNPSDKSAMLQTYSVSGSGLIVADSNMCYLVTAKHVATNMSPGCEVIMGSIDRAPLRFKLSDITGQPGVGWYFDPHADIAVHPLPTVTSVGMKALTRRAVPLGFLASGTNAPSRDITVTALGFPLGLGATGQFLPLCRGSKVSSGMLHDGQGYFYLLQDPSVSGYSGGPLVESDDARLQATPRGIMPVVDRPQCLGFVCSTYGDETGGKMCRIVPAFYAVDIIHRIERTMHVVRVPRASAK